MLISAASVRLPVPMLRIPLVCDAAMSKSVSVEISKELDKIPSGIDTFLANVQFPANAINEFCPPIKIIFRLSPEPVPILICPSEVLTPVPMLRTPDVCPAPNEMFPVFRFAPIVMSVEGADES